MRSPRNLDDAQTRQRRGPGALGRGGRLPSVRAPARATANASWLRECGIIMAVRLDSMCAPILPTGTPLGDAMEALGTAAAAATRRLGADVPPWERIAYFTSWRLLSPVARAG